LLLKRPQVSDFEVLPSPVLHTRSAPDGWLLRARDFSPVLPPRAIVVLGHAMMVDSRTLCRPDRPTLASVLVAAGFRVLVPDLRGHADSGPRAGDGGEWDCDDIVADVGEFVALAQSLEPERPLVLVGHSLFAQASLAWLGQHPDAPVQAVVALTCDVWNRRFEPSRLIGWLKFWVIALTTLVVRVVGHLPVRLARAGSADEAAGYWRQSWMWLRRDRWCSVDGGVDYWAGLSRIQAPVLHMLSAGDRLYARPVSAARWTAPVRTRELMILGREDAPGDLAGLRPKHMAAATDPASKLAWHWIAGWIERRLIDPSPDSDSDSDGNP